MRAETCLCCSMLYHNPAHSRLSTNIWWRVVTLNLSSSLPYFKSKVYLVRGDLFLGDCSVCIVNESWDNYYWITGFLSRLQTRLSDSICVFWKVCGKESKESQVSKQLLYSPLWRILTIFPKEWEACQDVILYINRLWYSQMIWRATG